MNATNLSESNAFSEGSQLWIIKNDPTLIWWKKLDLNSKYLLSQNHLHEKKPKHAKLENIILATKLNFFSNKFSSNYILVGSEDHFLNKWILLWNDMPQSEALQIIESVTIKLNAVSIRFFSNSELIPKIEARPMASSCNISYIENI